MNPGSEKQHDISLVAELRGQHLFDSLDSQAQAEMENELESVHLAKGQVLFHQDDPGDAMYFILRGVLEVTTRTPDGGEMRIDMLDSGTSVGEMALLTGQGRSATVTSLMESELARLSSAGFGRLAQQYPQIFLDFAHSVQPRIQRTQLSRALAGLFGPLETQALHELQSKVSWVHLAAGEILMRKDEPGDCMYIVINGRLRAVQENDEGGETALSEIASGETVGEFALLTGEPRSATVYAMRDSDVVQLSQPVFEQLMQDHPQAMFPITRSIILRSRPADGARKGTRESARHNTCITLALVPASPDVPLAEFARHLTAALQPVLDTLALSAPGFDHLFGKDGAAQTPRDSPAHLAVNGWLSEAEQKYRCIVYEGDASLSAWTQRCLRQADRILLVALSGGDRSIGEIEALLYSAASGFARTAELVLIQPDDASRPRDTLSWLSPRPELTHHHVRMGAAGDFQRLARQVSGRCNGLVLSGGGARGFAHLGAMRALQEAGIEIDLIGGTSMGALMGAALAMDWDYATILKAVKTFASPRNLLDYTLPYTSLVETGKVTRLLQNLFGDVQIEDLWRGYFCISSSLTRAIPIVHRRGPLWQAVRASIAIPGIFAPLLLQGEVLVDGGVMDPFPVDVMRELCGVGTVIGVNTSPKQEKLRDYQFGPSVSGWQILWSKLNPLARKRRAPSILSSLMRASEINGIYRNPSLAAAADLVIRPPVERFGSLDFAAYEEIIELGYEEAKKRLAEAK